MTAEFPAIAAQNTPLLRAIAEGPATSRADLAERAAVRPDNLNRKLDSLEAAGLIASTGEQTWEVAITPEGERALRAIATWEGQAMAEAGASGGQLVRLDPDLIDTNPWQPRTALDTDAEGDEQMALSIADKDILQPITVRRVGERYQQALGHRRVRGARLAKERGFVPADYGVPAVVRDLTDHAMEEIAIVENVQREDLHWMDEAEAYLRLANRGLSATDILRLVGPQAQRKKRSVQDLILIARGLSNEDKARTRLPEGDPNRLTVEPAKFLVGQRKAKSALDLSARQACALMELLLAGEYAEGTTDGELAVMLHGKPTSPALVTLGDKGLVKFTVGGGAPVALVQLTEAVAAFAAERGLMGEDPEAALAAARAEVVGELSAAALAAAHRFATDELNRPEPAEEKAAVDPKQADLLGAAEPPAEDGRLKLKPLHALAVTEVAHKLQRAALPQAGGWVRAGERYALDPLAQQLVYERLVMFMPQAGANAVSLTPTAQVWLDQQQVPRGDDGVAQVSDEVLLYRQAEVGVMPGGLRYATTWLNPDPEPIAPRTDPRAAAGDDTRRGCCWSNLDEPHVPGCANADPPAHAMRGEGAPPRDAFMQGILDVTAEQPATEPPAITPIVRPAPTALAVLQRLLHAADEAERALRNAAGRSRVKPSDVAPARELLGHAMAEAAAYLANHTQESTDAEA